MTIDALVIFASAVLAVIGLSVSVWSLMGQKFIQAASGDALTKFGEIFDLERFYYGSLSFRQNPQSAWMNIGSIEGWYECDSAFRKRLCDRVRRC